MSDNLNNEEKIVRFPNENRETMPKDDDFMNDYFIGIINSGIKVLNARLLGILALIGAIGVWSLCAWDPITQRLWAGAGYSLGVLIPTLMLYSKKG